MLKPDARLTTSRHTTQSNHQRDTMTPYLFALMSVVNLCLLYRSIRAMCKRPRWWRDAPCGYRVADIVLSFASVLCFVAAAALFAGLAYFEWRHQ